MKMATSLRARIKQVVFDRVPGLLRKGPVGTKRVALTFDDGPDDMTSQYLDVLDDLGVPATFFLLGEGARARPDDVRDYMRRGHQIASHGYDHQRFTQLGHHELLEQCARTDEAIGGSASRVHCWPSWTSRTSPGRHLSAEHRSTRTAGSLSS